MKYAFFALFLLGGITIAADDAESKKLLRNLEGSYKVTAVEKSGDPPPKEFLESLEKVTIKGNKFAITFRGGGKAEEKSATIDVDATKTPATINLKPDDGEKRNETVVGIVQIEEDTVKICWADGAKSPRPTRFETNKENKQFMLTLQRTKE
jgi:uncharacterized protein (TIGR03067 family)